MLVTSPPKQAPDTRTFRPELQGLRAVAAVLVVVYHVWLGRVSGGVDVFFLISGFLLTGQLVRTSKRGGIDFRALWSRMAKRLFPAALTVLAVTIGVSVLVLPENRWFQTIREVVASALYLENWQLVAASADYFADHDRASVVQHFWSLSIQGQFYLVWPLLVAAVVALRRSLLPVLLVVFTGSLACSVWLTAVDQPLAYFHTATRLWEFALGGLLALVITAIDIPRATRLVLGWLGLAGLVACGLVLQVGTVFPGWLALWPTTCAAIVIIAGASSSRCGADRLLAARPLTYLGDLSYALYLWHWPILIFYLVSRGQSEIGLRGGAVVIALSFALAAATHHLVEKPARASRWSARTLSAALLVPVLTATAIWQAAGIRKAESYSTLVDNPDHPGALARLPDFEYWGADDVPPVPPLINTDFAALDQAHCVRSAHDKDLEICSTPADGTPAKRVVLVGDSHVQQYIAALTPIAQQRGWQLITMTKGACPFSTRSEVTPGDRSCLRWNDSAAREIRSQRPDFVFTLATRNVRIGLTEHTPTGFVERWRELEAAGIPVIAVRDNPRYSFSVAECVRVHGSRSHRCGAPRADLLATVPPYAQLNDLPPNVSFVDFSDYLCADDLCPPVIGNVLVNFDDNHVSATYMRSMAPIVAQAIDEVTAG